MGVGFGVGVGVGFGVGVGVGFGEGVSSRVGTGAAVGADVGSAVGSGVGSSVGSAVGSGVRSSVGAKAVAGITSCVGAKVGSEPSFFPVPFVHAFIGSIVNAANITDSIKFRYAFRFKTKVPSACKQLIAGILPHKARRGQCAVPPVDYTRAKKYN